MWESGEKGCLGLGGRELRRWFWPGSDVSGADFSAVCVSGEVLLGSPSGGETGMAVRCEMLVGGFMQYVFARIRRAMCCRQRGMSVWSNLSGA